MSTMDFYVDIVKIVCIAHIQISAMYAVVVLSIINFSLNHSGKEDLVSVKHRGHLNPSWLKTHLFFCLSLVLWRLLDDYIIRKTVKGVCVCVCACVIENYVNTLHVRLRESDWTDNKSVPGALSGWQKIISGGIPCSNLLNAIKPTVLWSTTVNVLLN